MHLFLYLHQVLGGNLDGLYVTGWLKRGPSGIIGTNINDARETLQTMLYDAENNCIPPLSTSGKVGIDAVIEELASHGHDKKVTANVVRGYVRRLVENVWKY